MDAKWLFENHKEHLAEEKHLLAQITYLKQLNTDQTAEEIEGIILKRPPLGIPFQNNHQGSTTERVAIELNEDKDLLTEKSIKKYSDALAVCRYYLEVYEAVILFLNEREAWLIEKIYNQSMTLSIISTLPESPYKSYDRTTLYRIKKKIIEKANHFLQMNSLKEVSPCQLEKYSNGSKR